MAYVVEKSKDKQFTLAEVAEHASDKSRFIIINDNVYDVTKFIDEVHNRARLHFAELVCSTLVAWKL